MNCHRIGSLISEFRRFGARFLPVGSWEKAAAHSGWVYSDLM